MTLAGRHALTPAATDREFHASAALQRAPRRILPVCATTRSSNDLAAAPHAEPHAPHLADSPARRLATRCIDPSVRAV